MSPMEAGGIMFKRAPRRKTEMMYKFFAPVLSPQDIRAPALLLTSSMKVIATFITAHPHHEWSPLQQPHSPPWAHTMLLQRCRSSGMERFQWLNFILGGTGFLLLVFFSSKLEHP
jgi:hypothetical protein